MGIITWELVKIRNERSENISLSIRELDNGVATGRQYTARMHKSKPLSEFKKMLKKQIIKDRAKRTDEDNFKTKIDLGNFETYINQ